MKISIDFIFTVGTYCPLTIFKNKKKFIMILDNLKSHKNQPIRVSAQQALKVMKLNEEEVTLKTERLGIRDQILSPKFIRDNKIQLHDNNIVVLKNKRGGVR